MKAWEKKWLENFDGLGPANEPMAPFDGPPPPPGGASAPVVRWEREPELRPEDDHGDDERRASRAA